MELAILIAVFMAGFIASEMLNRLVEWNAARYRAQVAGGAAAETLGRCCQRMIDKRPALQIRQRSRDRTCKFSERSCRWPTRYHSSGTLDTTKAYSSSAEEACQRNGAHLFPVPLDALFRWQNPGGSTSCSRASARSAYGASRAAVPR